MKTKLPQVYIGFDPRGADAYEVARNSIAHCTKGPLKIMPLRLPHLGMLTRPIQEKDGKLWCPISQAFMSTEFAISRFCVPFLQEEGWALFTDCDIVCWTDINELFALADPKYAIMVVKQKGGLQSLNKVKMDGQAQVYYDRKNWSSVVLWNCEHPANKGLTELRLNRWPGRDLHAFKWLRDEEIGELPDHWNWLINVTPGEPAKRGIWHYTLGGPWFPDWAPAKYDEAWKEANELLLPASK